MPSKKKTPTKKGTKSPKRTPSKKATSPARMTKAQLISSIEKAEGVPNPELASLTKKELVVVAEQVSPKRGESTSRSKSRSRSRSKSRSKSRSRSRSRSKSKSRSRSRTPSKKGSKAAPTGKSKSPTKKSSKSPTKKTAASRGRSKFSKWYGEGESRSRSKSKSRSRSKSKSKSRSRTPTKTPTKTASKKTSPGKSKIAGKAWVQSPVTQRWIEVGGPTYNKLYEAHKAYFATAKHRKGNLYGKHGCSNVEKYRGQPGPFCGPTRCGGPTYPVRSPGEYRAAIRYSVNADPADQEEIRACATRVAREKGWTKNGGTKKSSK